MLNNWLKKYFLKASLKAALSIKLIEVKTGDVISLKLAAKLCYESIMLRKPLQNERGKGVCPRSNAIAGSNTTLTQDWKGPRAFTKEMS